MSMPAPEHTFSKEERICGKSAIALLMDKGHWGSTSCIRYCYMEGQSDRSRILVSVPKRHFKRAVRRNLLKRRIREAYRLNKDLLSDARADIMLVYTQAQIQTFAEIEADVKSILKKIGARAK